jgi:hypothetical protein
VWHNHDRFKNKPLQLWDALNKIIHATTVKFDRDMADHMGMLVFSTDKDVHHVPHYWNPLVHLYGENRGQQWKATLDVIQYVELMVRLIESYDWASDVLAEATGRGPSVL